MKRLGELMQAISKSVRGSKSETTRQNIMEELVDVEIMLEQLKIIYSFSGDDLEWMRLRKINRLEKRLK